MSLCTTNALTFSHGCDMRELEGLQRGDVLNAPEGGEIEPEARRMDLESRPGPWGQVYGSQCRGRELERWQTYALFFTVITLSSDARSSAVLSVGKKGGGLPVHPMLNALFTMCKV